MIIDLNNGEEITDGGDGWNTEKTYSQQSSATRLLASQKAASGFYDGVITNESGGGNERPLNSSWVEFGLTYTISPNYMTGIETKSFLLWSYAVINITKNI